MNINDTELENKKSLQYKLLKENVDKVFGKSDEDFVESVLGVVLKSIHYNELHLEEVKRLLEKNIKKIPKEILNDTLTTN